MSGEASPTVVTVKPRKALPFFSHHPWVFEGALQGEGQGLSVGQQVMLRAHTGEFIAYGLANPNSKIRIRLYSWKEDQPLDEGFWKRKLDAAIALRQRLALDKDERGFPINCRLVFSEGDGLSGLTVDRYGDFLLLQWTSAALAQRAEIFTQHLIERLQPKGLWLRTEKGMSEAEGLQLRDGLIYGEAPPRPLIIEEDGRKFAVDVVEGHKTGHYFDQRENRTWAAMHCFERRILELFCYTGGFTVAAADVGKATTVLAVDSSATALELARRNAELNHVAERITFEESDAFRKFESLHSAGEKFDVVILDPPKMARTRGGLDRALRGYHSLNKLAMQVLVDDGILITCSCSGLVSREQFQDMLAKAALDAGRFLQILEIRGAAEDHPVNIHCPETAYLKCFICRVVKEE